MPQSARDTLEWLVGPPTPMGQYGRQMAEPPDAALQYLLSFIPVEPQWPAYDNPYPTWQNSYHGGIPSPGAFRPLPNAPIDESRFWREPTPWDRLQQGLGGFAQNFDQTNMRHGLQDFMFNGPGGAVLNLPRGPWSR